MSSEQPIVIDCRLIFGKLVKITFDNDYILYINPQDPRNVKGLKYFSLLFHGHVHARVETNGYIKQLSISKRYLAELLDIAYHDYLLWEDRRSVSSEIHYAKCVAETTSDIALDLRYAAA